MSRWAFVWASGAAMATLAVSTAQPWDADGRVAPRDPAAKASAPPDSLGRVGFPEFPSLSPDGKLVAFAWAGDLWISPIQGGICSRLTSHPAEERRSAFSPDGKWLAFESSRDGARNLYVMPLAWDGGRVTGGTPVRVTTSDQAQGLGSFTSDGSGLLFSSNKEPAIYRGARMFRVPLRVEGGAALGGGPVSRLSDVFGTLPRMGGDGKTVVFGRNTAPLERPRYRGSGNQDIWAMEASSGAAGKVTRLTDDLANDAEAWMRPDGSVVFISSRDGQNNIWKLAKAESGQTPEQLTHFSPAEGELTIGHGVRDLAVSADGRMAVFAVWNRLYSLDLGERGAKPAPISLRAAGDSAVPDFQRLNLEKEVNELAISPDGKSVAVVARGDIFVRSTQEGYPTRRITDTPGRERDLAWSPDGKLLYFASDDAGKDRPAGGGGENAEGLYAIYAAGVSLTREDIAPEKDKPKAADKPAEKKADPAAADDTPPDADADAAKPATSKLKRKDRSSKESKPDYGKRWAEALRFSIESVVSGDEDVRNPVPSPDGKKLLFTRGRGDLVQYELSTKVERVLVKAFEETDASWAADSRHVVYALSDLDFNSDIWLMDTGPAASPGAADAPSEGAAAGVEQRPWPNPVNLTKHPDLDVSPRLSVDAKVLTFLSERGGENGEFDVYQVYLDKALEGMNGYERDEYFKKAAEAAGKLRPLGAPEKDSKSSDKKPGDKKGDGDDGEKKEPDKADEGKKKDEPPSDAKPLKFDADDAYLRVRRLVSLPGAESNLAITPAADRVVFVGTVEGDRALVSVDHKGGDRKTLQAGAVGSVSLTLTGDKLGFVKAGVVSTTNPKTGGKVDALPIDAPVIIDVAHQQRQKFLEAAKSLGKNFYHPTLKGLDWPGLTRRYLALAEQTRTNEEFNRVTFSLFNELDGSHLGITGGAPFVAVAPSPAVGYLGAVTTPAPGGFRVVTVARETPADAPATRLREGDLIVAVDSQRLAPSDSAMPTLDLDAALAGRAGKETLIEVRHGAPADGAEATKLQTLLVTPMSFAAWDVAQYWDEVGRRQKLVEKLSDGKIGYLHIRAMGEASVRDFERDLYAAGSGKQALIIDVRDNGGGSTADILLSALTAPRHAWTVPRGPDPESVPHDSYPRDRRLIYAWTRPIDVLINQNSFSNAEIFAHAIQTIGRGKLIGTATFGGVISTGATTLIDGTTVRLPTRGWYLPDGTDMESHGASPEVDVAQTPEDEAAGKDRQLEAAVEELMHR